MLAKYPGKCPNCEERFEVGKDYIEKKENGKWAHVSCNVPKYTGKVMTHSQTYTVSKPTYFDSDALDAVINAKYIGEEEQPKNNFVPTHFQVAIFEFIKDPQQYCEEHNIPFSIHAVIEAVAGSGKTTTITEGLKLTPRDAQVAFVAFNSHIAKELKRRAPDHVHVSTLHSLGLFNIRQNIGKQPKIEPDKVGILLGDLWPVSKEALDSGKITKQERAINYVKRISMRKLVAISKSIMVDENNRDEVLEMVERYNIDIDTAYLEELLEELPGVLERCQKMVDVIDFDDMLWLPVVLKMNLKQFDFLMVDEAQDMNKCQIEFIMRSIIPDVGRVIAVGDRHQSLYAFRGADSEAIQNIIQALDAVTLPLSITFRCPTSHVEIAQRIVTQIEAKENALAGSIVDLDYFNLVSTVEFGDMIICRTNAPLIKPAFECIRRGKKAVIKGKDIGDELINLIKRFETNDVSSFDVMLGQYFENEHTRLMDKGKEMQAQILEDKVETLREIIKEVNTVAELMNKIKMLFDDDSTGIYFSSVHRAKGLEAENVYILRPDLFPHPRAKKPYEQQQELNCLYVAITRSKNNLIFVKGDENGPLKGDISPLLKANN